LSRARELPPEASSLTERPSRGEGQEEGRASPGNEHSPGSLYSLEPSPRQRCHRSAVYMDAGQLAGRRPLGVQYKR
jgi:hypothetical protein